MALIWMWNLPWLWWVLGVLVALGIGSSFMDTS